MRTRVSRKLGSKKGPGKQEKQEKSGKPGPKPGRPPSTGQNTSILRLLAKQGLSQEELAARVGSGPSYISHILRGRKQPSLRKALLIAEVLGVSLDKLTTELQKGKEN